jgi:hypothetical protein
MTDERPTQHTDSADHARLAERDPATNIIVSRLRELRNDSAAPYDWSEFKRRSQGRRGSQWHRTAIAASFVLVLAGIAGWMRFSADHDLEQSADSSDGDSIVGLNGNTVYMGPRDSAGSEAVAAYHASFGEGPVMTWESSDTQRATSQWLADLPNEPAIVRVGTRGAVIDLEDHIALIDDMLNNAQVESAPPAHIQTLKRERAQLISSLARVRYAETLAASR